MGNFPEYKREFKYTCQLTDNTAYMLLSLPIGDDGKTKDYIIGAIFAEEMYFWKRAGRDIFVKINSPGGNIMQGFSIIDAVRETEATTQCVGIAASMAGLILLSGKKRESYDYGKLMIHPPMGGDKFIREVFRDSLSTILISRSKYTETEVTNLLKEGAPDTWILSDEMKTRGLVDEVIPTKSKPMVSVNDPYAMYEIYNTLIKEEEMAITPHTPDPKVEQAYTEVMAGLLNAKDTISTLQTEKAALEAKLSAYENAEKSAKESAAKLKVENAIKEKKLSDKPELKDQFVKMALEAPEAFDALITTATAVTRPSVVNHMKKNEDVPTEETYEYLANNDPKRLYDLMDNEPEKYQKLVNKWQEKQKAA